MEKITNPIDEQYFENGLDKKSAKIGHVNKIIENIDTLGYNQIIVNTNIVDINAGENCIKVFELDYENKIKPTLELKYTTNEETVTETAIIEVIDENQVKIVLKNSIYNAFTVRKDETLKKIYVYIENIFTDTTIYTISYKTEYFNVVDFVAYDIQNVVNDAFGGSVYINREIYNTETESGLNSITYTEDFINVSETYYIQLPRTLQFQQISYSGGNPVLENKIIMNTGGGFELSSNNVGNNSASYISFYNEGLYLAYANVDGNIAFLLKGNTINVSGLQTFVDNAAALAFGFTQGDMYIDTSGNLKVVI